MGGEYAVPQDLVVVVPGITGSSLADARGREVWGLGAGSLIRALATLGGSLRDLTLPADFGEGAAPDGVGATGLIMGLHGIPGVWTPGAGYRALMGFLGQRRFGLSLDRPDGPPGNLVPFAYDWRLSNRWTAVMLKRRVEHALTRWRASAPERRDAKVVFICHSMGGLVARHYIERNGGAEVTRSLITLGTPHRGALDALERLVNGVRKGVGPLRLDLTGFLRSLPSSYELLPEYACIEGADMSLLKVTERELPGLSSEMVKMGVSFHNELDQAPPDYSLLPVVGIGQPTSLTARLVDDRVVPLPTINGREPKGDGTVPRLSARPRRLEEHDPSIKGVGEGHGSLPSHRSVLEQLEFVLTAEEVTYRAADAGEVDDDRLLGVSVSDFNEAGERMKVTVSAAEPRLLQVVALDESGRESARELVRFDDASDREGRALGVAAFEPLAPGGYWMIAMAPDDPGGLEVQPVRATTLVWGMA